MDLLQVSGIYRQEGGKDVLKGIGFAQQKAQKLAIMGESGAGKSTLLKIIAGLAQPSAGEVLFEGRRVPGPNEKLIPGHPGIGYLSQHYELRNNYRVEEILSSADELPTGDAAILFEVCRIDHLLQRRTDQLSGGEKQRIALARLLVGSPRLLLLDEPFSNLDLPHTRLLKSVINDIGERLGITCLLVSHDPHDILSWAEDLLIIKDGTILQQGSPEEIYRRPVNEYTGGLLGDYCLLSPADAAVLTGSDTGGKRLFVRPDQLLMVPAGEKTIAGRVGRVAFAGTVWEVDIWLPRYAIKIYSQQPSAGKGDTVHLSLAPGDLWYME
ncbi:MAG: ABC transporter ATP-binding protein [Bacteroidetes bacterium]|nr:ABC transporter ATP-binding protein [Bacteroidota bacterium]